MAHRAVGYLLIAIGALLCALPALFPDYGRIPPQDFGPPSFDAYRAICLTAAFVAIPSGILQIVLSLRTAGSRETNGPSES